MAKISNRQLIELLVREEVLGFAQEVSERLPKKLLEKAAKEVKFNKNTESLLEKWKNEELLSCTAFCDSLSVVIFRSS